MRNRIASRMLSCAVALLLCAQALAGQTKTAQKVPQGLDGILQYISTGWGTLTRSMSDCKTVSDPKAPENSVLYFPADVSIPESEKALEKTCGVKVEHLPAVITKLGSLDANTINPHGLLYLPNSYVVPGGMFNEMYGWDSYFILRGLLRAGKVDLARGIVENFFYEIDHYGGFLNANRGYVLQRSQPPFLTSMIVAVYEAEKANGRKDTDWLARAYPYAVKDYQLWSSDPHLAGSTGLSRFYAFGDGPVPELGSEGESYYRDVARYFMRHPDEAGPYLSRVEGTPDAAPTVGPVYRELVCNSEGASPDAKDCSEVQKVGLSKEFYKGDRSMRESGFDISFRFGAYGSGTPDFAPVGLNSLLYKAEKDLEWMSNELGKQQDADEWEGRAIKRRREIEKYLWNADHGMFFDYDFTTHKQSHYIFATTFYPLWAGLATPAQAKAVDANLKLFEQPGGLLTSRNETTAQWDYPYGWAPLQLIAVEGLRRYGFDEDADRVSFEFLSDVLQNFRRDGTIREKYNVLTSSSEFKIRIGYSQNVVGFGWTNGVFLELLHELPEQWKARLAAE